MDRQDTHMVGQMCPATVCGRSCCIPPRSFGAENLFIDKKEKAVLALSVADRAFVF
jgi:hypothetical protein